VVSNIDFSSIFHLCICIRLLSYILNGLKMSIFSTRCATFVTIITLLVTLDHVVVPHIQAHQHRDTASRRHFLETQDTSFESREFDLSFYHTTAQLNQEFKQLQPNCPGMQFSFVSDFGSEIPAIRMASTKAAPARPSHRVLMFFGEHARELISPESALAFMQHLCLVDASTKDVAMRILADAEFLIFPNINLEGRRSVEAGQYCVRANENGVDLNRNWNDHWEDDTGNAQAKRRQAFGGTKPFSEPETEALKKYAAQFMPTIFLTIHSGCLGMYTPYAYSGKMPTDGNADHVLMSILNPLNRKYCNCEAGAAGKEVGYLCPGTCLDYMYDKLGTKLSYAFEIFDGQHGFKNDNPALVQTSESIHRAHHRMQQQQQQQQQQNTRSKQGVLDQRRSSVKTPSNTVDESEPAMRHSSCFVASSSNVNETLLEEEIPNLVELEDGPLPYPIPRRHREKNCLRQFNPISKDMFLNTLENWSRAFLEVIDMSMQSPLGKVNSTQQLQQ
jgi:Zinc carboxypeptidase